MAQERIGLHGNGLNGRSYEAVSPAEREGQPRSFGWYKEALFSGEINPPHNAADLVVRALTDPTRHEIERMPSGLIAYRVFDRRTDGLAIYGMYEGKAAFMQALAADARTGGNANAITLVVPSGGGKSTMVGGILGKELGQYTRTHPLMAMQGCPLRETPDHLLSDSERQQLYETTGRIVRGDPCPDCQEKWNNAHENPDDIEIEEFTVIGNRGFAEMDPRFTAPGDWKTQEYLSNIARAANRGLLHIPEFGRQGAVVYEMLDFFRGLPLRRLSRPDGSGVDNIDCVMIATTTPKEFETLLNPKNHNAKPERVRAFRERMHVIQVPQNLSHRAEITIYEKFLRDGGFTDTVHTSPNTLEMLAKLALLTRVKTVPGTFPTLDKNKRIAIYDGQSVPGFDATPANLAKFHQEARSAEEGMDGISVPTMRTNIFSLYNAAIESSGVTFGGTEKGCIFPYDALAAIGKSLKEAGSRLGVPQDIEALIEGTQQEYRTWLRERVLAAFNKRYTPMIESVFDTYIADLDRIMSTEQEEAPDILDTTTEPIALVRARIREVEQHNPYLKSDTMNEEVRREQRTRILSDVGRAMRQRQNDTGFSHGKTDNTLSFLIDDPTHGDAIEHVVQAVRKHVTKSSETAEDILAILASKDTFPDEEQQVRIAEAEQMLIDDESFCTCCAPKALQLVGQTIAKQRQEGAQPVFPRS